MPRRRPPPCAPRWGSGAGPHLVGGSSRPRADRLRPGVPEPRSGARPGGRQARSVSRPVGPPPSRTAHSARSGDRPWRPGCWRPCRPRPQRARPPRTRGGAPPPRRWCSRPPTRPWPCTARAHRARTGPGQPGSGRSRGPGQGHHGPRHRRGDGPPARGTGLPGRPTRSSASPACPNPATGWKRAGSPRRASAAHPAPSAIAAGEDPARLMPRPLGPGSRAGESPEAPGRARRGGSADHAPPP